MAYAMDDAEEQPSAYAGDVAEAQPSAYAMDAAEAQPSAYAEDSSAEEGNMEIPSGLPEAVPGNVLVAVRKDAYSTEAAADSPGTALLRNAEMLMEVEGASPEEGLSSATWTSEDGLDAGEGASYELKLVHSDSYDASQMIGMLEALPSVAFAEPDYVGVIPDAGGAGPAMEMEEAGAEAVPEAGEAGPAMEIEEAGAEAVPDAGGAGPAMEIEDQPVAGVSSARDYSALQHAYGSRAGAMDVPSWNTAGYLNAAGTVIAVLDTGVDYLHPDLKEVMWDEGLSYPSLKALGGGAYGYNSYQGKAYTSDDPMDDNNHGTNCAGIAAASWNQAGISGVANGAKIMAVKMANASGSFTYSSLLRGYNYIKEAKKAGVNVVATSHSFTARIESNVVSLAIAELGGLGIVSSFASANDGRNSDQESNVASLLREVGGAVVVNSHDAKGEKSSFSGYGEKNTDISAPGNMILTAYPRSHMQTDPMLCTPVSDNDGRYAMDDFSGAETYFTYSAMSGNSVSWNRIEDMDTGFPALKVTGLDQKIYFMKISGNALPKEPKYLTLSARCSIGQTAAIYPCVLNQAGKYVMYTPKAYLGTDYASDVKYSLESISMNLTHPEVLLYMQCPSGKEEQLHSAEVYLNGISFTDEEVPYGFNHGSTMAAPSVAGEAAVLAARWGKDDADRLAARIIGSAETVSGLSKTSRTGGAARVRNALECVYSPVVEAASIDREGRLKVSGYFFGELRGKAELSYQDRNGNPVVRTYEGEDGIPSWQAQSASEWSQDGKNGRDSILISTGISANDAAYPDGEVQIRIIAGDGKSRKRYLEVRTEDGRGRSGRYYDLLPLPEDDGFKGLVHYASAGLDGALYYAGLERRRDNSYYLTWQYTLPTEKQPEGAWKKTKKAICLGTYSNLCAWNHMLAFFDTRDQHLCLYDPFLEEMNKTSISAGSISANNSSAYLVNAGNILYLFLTGQVYSPSKKAYVDHETRVYRVDVANRRVQWVYTTSTVQKTPVLCYYGDASGSGTLYVLSKSDETHILVEEISMNRTEALERAGVSIKALPEGSGFLKEELKGSASPYGIVLTGPYDPAGENDNFLYDLRDGQIHAMKKKISPGRIYNTMSTSYGGKVYFMGHDPYRYLQETFACASQEDFRGEGERKEPLPDYGDGNAGGGNEERVFVELLPSPERDVLPVGRSLKLSPSVKKSGNTKLSYTYYSKDGLLAKTDRNGRLTALTPGKGEVIAEAYDPSGIRYLGKFSFTSVPLITKLKLDRAVRKAAEGKSFELLASAYPENTNADYIEFSIAMKTSGGSLALKSLGSKEDLGNEKTALFEAGTGAAKAVITAKTTDGSNRKASCTVTIGVPAEGIVLKNGKTPFDPLQGLTVNEGKTVRLKAEVNPANAVGKAVEWSSDDEDVAKVRGGLVTGTGAGQTVIHAVALDGSGVSQNIPVSVNAPVKKASLSTTGKVTLGKGMSLSVSLVDVKPAYCSAYTVEWKSSDGSVSVSSDSSGNHALIKAESPGSAKVTAIITNKAPGGKEKVEVKPLHVRVVEAAPPADRISIFRGQKDITSSGSGRNRLQVNKTTKLSTVVLNKNKIVKNAVILWKSSDPSVAAISNGVLKAYKEGVVRITATAIPQNPGEASAKAYCSFYIYHPVKKLAITDENGAKLKSIILTKGKEQDFSVNMDVDPETRADDVREKKSVSVNSDKPKVASVSIKSGLGTIRASSAGEAVITAKASDGSGKTAKCTVTVRANATGVVLRTKGLKNAKETGKNTAKLKISGLKKGSGFYLVPTVSPTNAYVKGVSYQSSDSSVVSVTSKGYVKRKKGGAADIYAITTDGGYRAVCHIEE
ncbi:MAG: Ig-like domain-containing protein [Lachnospiraceae bacterium]|nr:Ig-like domain-containing protein [Lachnospiraceae bacterium]